MNPQAKINGVGIMDVRHGIVNFLTLFNGLNVDFGVDMSGANM